MKNNWQNLWIKHHQVILLGITIAIILLIPLFIPRQSTYLVNLGADRYENHLKLSSQATIGQTFIAQRDTLSQIDILIVPFGKSELAGDIILTISDQAGNKLRQSRILASSITDDTFETFTFQPLTNVNKQPLTLTLQISEHRSRAAVAVRFNPDEQSIAGGTLFKDDRLIQGDLALRLTRQTNLYGQLRDQLPQNPNLLREISLSLMAGAVIALLYVLLANNPSFTSRKITISRLMIIILLVVIVLGSLRFTIMDEARGVSGGDAYNFFFIKQRIQESLTFYTSPQKRLPVFSISLIPGDFITSDIQANARAVNQVVVILTLISLAIVGRQLKLPAQAVFLGVLLTTINRDFFSGGFRPLAYPMVGLLILAGLAALFWAQSNPKRIVIASLLLGLAAQTRHEGIFAAGALIVVVTIIWLLEKRWKAALAMIVPFILILTPYIIANIINHGNPFYVGYLDHPVTNPHRSLAQLYDHIGLTWGVLGSSWWYKWVHEFRIQLDPVIRIITTIAILVAAAIPMLQYRFKLKRNLLPIIATPLVLAGFIFWILTLLLHSNALGTYTSMTIFITTLIGIYALAVHAVNQRSRDKKTSLVDYPPVKIGLLALVAASLFIIAYWIHPVAKQFYSFYPYLGLLAGLGIFTLLQSLFGQQSYRHFLGLTLIFTMLALPSVKAFASLLEAMDFESRKNVQDQLAYNLARHAADNNLAGTFATQDWLLPYEYFLGAKPKTYEANDGEPTLQELQSQGANWILWTSFDKQFGSYISNPDFYPVEFSVYSFDRDDERVEGRILKIPPL